MDTFNQSQYVCDFAKVATGLHHLAVEGLGARDDAVFLLHFLNEVECVVHESRIVVLVEMLLEVDVENSEKQNVHFLY